MLYEDRSDLDDRTRTRLESVLTVGERFVLAGQCDDALFYQWATRFVVTTDRVLTVRHTLVEWSVEGARHDWIQGVGHIWASTGRLEREVDADEFSFPGTGTADAVLEAAEDQRTPGAVGSVPP